MIQQEIVTLDSKEVIGYLCIRPVVGEIPYTDIIYENQAYTYDVKCTSSYHLEVRSSCTKRDRNITAGMSDSGIISTIGFCGLLHLEFYEQNTMDRGPIGQSFIDVHSRKIDYESSYRGMVLRLAHELAGILADARSATHLPYISTANSLEQFTWFQLQLELLRAIVEHSEFAEALERIFHYPHEKLDDEDIKQATQRQKEWNPRAIHQLLYTYPQQSVPPQHVLYKKGIRHVATHIITPRRIRTLNTVENQFIKYTLHDYLQFSKRVHITLQGKPGWESTTQLAYRIGNQLQHYLDHSLFTDVDDLQQLPLHSPVLQRKAGYRELLQWWIRFHSSMDVHWKESAELFAAGNRKTETLYEYWLFFVLLEVFETYCGRHTNRQSLFDETSNGVITIRQGGSKVQGNFRHNGQEYTMIFGYNTTYQGANSNASWTVNMRPDYTFTIFPTALGHERQAASSNQLVRIHFDAKYRVDTSKDIFRSFDDEHDEYTGNESSSTADNYKRDDVRKMHAYLNGIHHSIGAFVLFPGSSGAKPVLFKRQPSSAFPSIGAFSVSPDSAGNVQSLDGIHALFQQIFDSLTEHFQAYYQTETP